jgi:hypothetical protein
LLSSNLASKGSAIRAERRAASAARDGSRLRIQCNSARVSICSRWCIPHVVRLTGPSRSIPPSNAIGHLSPVARRDLFIKLLATTLRNPPPYFLAVGKPWLATDLLSRAVDWRSHSPTKVPADATEPLTVTAALVVVAIRTMRLASALRNDTDAAQRVLTNRHRLEMVRIDATPIAAQVVKRQTVRNLAAMEQPRYAMRPNRPSTNMEHPVTARINSCEPQPTAIDIRRRDL